MASDNKKEKNIHKGHRARMRQRFMETGFNGFSQHQIVEMLLFYCCPRIDTNAMAHTLINRFGSLSGIIDASPDELMSITGINDNAVALFKMLPQCMQLYYSSRTEKESFDNTQKLIELFSSCYIGVTTEQFRVACFDNDLRLICNKIVCDGSPSFSPINLRRLTEIVFEAKSSYIAISHNHPCGSPYPSTDDIFATRRIMHAMSDMGITLLDHIIVGASLTVSLRDSAMINMFD